MTLSIAVQIALTQLAKKKPTAATIKKVRSILLKGKEVSHRTQTANFSHAKKIFKQRWPNAEILKEMRADPEVTEKVIAEDIKHRDSRKIQHVTREMIETILSFKGDKNIHLLAIYLLFASGRRSGELLSARIRNKPGSDKLKIDGVLKRSDGGEGCEFQTVVSKTAFLKEFKRFRSLTKYANLDTFQRTLSRKVKKKLGDGVHPHSLRGFYAAYMFKFRNKEQIPINPYIRDVLCHQSVNSSLNYTAFKVQFDQDFVR